MMYGEKDNQSAEGVTLSGVKRHETVCGHNSGEFRSIGRRRCKGLDFQTLISQAKGQGADMVTPCVVEENFIKSAGLLFFFVKELAVFYWRMEGWEKRRGDNFLA